MKNITIQIVDRLAQDLIANNIITHEQLTIARDQQEKLGEDLAHVLIKKGYISENKLFEIIGKKLHIPTILLKSYSIDPAVIKLLSVEQAKKFKILPLYKVEDNVTIATSDPLNVAILDEIKSILKCNLNIVIASEKDIQDALDTYYFDETQEVTEESISKELEILESAVKGEQNEELLSKLEREASGKRVVATVDKIIKTACSEKASDIHIEPTKKDVKIRFRIDGILEDAFSFPASMTLAIASRIKIMANMDVAERRVPQDGRIKIKIDTYELDLRISTFPTMYGETIAIRLLKKESLITLKDLGFDDNDRKKFESMIEKPHGMILVTGPTGSGKTTTLYSALQKINNKEKFIISIEDPIENEMEGVNQCQINVKAGLTFATSLRSILRQDPDIIMVGEIRDKETAGIAVRAAMTGHLLLSTLHTNTAISAISRLRDLEIEPFLINSTLLGVMAQRLVRKICVKCKEPYKEPVNLKDLLGVEHIDSFIGKGCEACRMTGYSGRVGLFEIVQFDDFIKELLNKNLSEQEILRELASRQHKTIHEDGLIKIKSGLTTISEVIRVTKA